MLGTYDSGKGGWWCSQLRPLWLWARRDGYGNSQTPKDL